MGKDLIIASYVKIQEVLEKDKSIKEMRDTPEGCGI
jgi:hypothetical protein